MHYPSFDLALVVFGALWASGGAAGATPSRSCTENFAVIADARTSISDQTSPAQPVVDEPAKQDAASPSEGTGEIPSGGMTLQQLLDWLAYLLKKGFQGHTEADGEGSVKRSHARALKLN